MNRTRTAVLAAAAALGLLGWTAQAQQRDGPAEKVGEKLDRAGRQAGRAVEQGLEKAGDSLRAAFARTRETVHGMGVEARIYGRLHWDKALSESDLELDFRDGVATLRGAVPTAEAKAKAVALARDTVGVTSVVDQLTIGATRPRTLPAAEVPGADIPAPAP